jgi:nucleotide-binding universal stress UspA family protein
MNAKKKPRPFNILLADDGSEHARAAIELLGELPLPDQSRVTALRIFTPIQSSYVAMMEAGLEKTKSLLEEKGFETEAELLLGYPGEKIIEYASTNRPDLIVVGAKGLRATLGILLGGVAQQVIEYACCPVLVVRAPNRPLRQILCVTDGSEHSQITLEYLSNFPLPVHATIKVLHVLPPLPPTMLIEPYMLGTEYIYPVRSPEEEEKELKAQEREGKALLEHDLKILSKQGIEATGVLKQGDAATEIIEYARTNGTDLIVAGSRGLNPIKSWLVGSVSRKLVHYSSCSVLIFKAPQAD